MGKKLYYLVAVLLVLLLAGFIGINGCGGGGGGGGSDGGSKAYDGTCFASVFDCVGDIQDVTSCVFNESSCSIKMTFNNGSYIEMDLSDPDMPANYYNKDGHLCFTEVLSADMESYVVTDSDGKTYTLTYGPGECDETITCPNGDVQTYTWSDEDCYGDGGGGGGDDTICDDAFNDMLSSDCWFANKKDVESIKKASNKMVNKMLRRRVR